MIISVHLPKTAGRSFEAALRSRFGDRLLEDYGSFPINSPRYERNRAALEASLRNAEHGLPGVECVHGHFLPVTYLLLSCRRETTFVTWMRDPVQRMISHYFYWQRTYQPDTSPALHRRVVEEEWSLERFCLSDEMQNLYESFFWAFPVQNFGFVGVTEFYDDDLAYFARHFLGVTVEPQRVNVGEGRYYDLDPVLRRRIEAFHETDMERYEWAMDRRRARG